MAFGITEQGFNTKSLSQIRSEINADYLGEFGDNFNLDPTLPAGMQIGIMSERFASIWEKLKEVYDSQFPESSTGVTLENIASITGVFRIPSRPTRVTVTFTGTANTIIPAQFRARIPNASYDFVLPSSVVIGDDGTVDAELIASVHGPNEAEINQVTEIINPISGLDSITNRAFGITGRNVESDTDLKIRRLVDFQRRDVPTIEAITLNLLDLNGVKSVISNENKTSETNVETGLPPHSYEFIIHEGLNEDIAQVIYNSRIPGVNNVGSVSHQITDSQGNLRDVFFSRPTRVSIYILISLIVEDEYFNSSDRQEEIKTALNVIISDYVNGKTIRDTFALIEILDHINDVPGVLSVYSTPESLISTPTNESDFTSLLTSGFARSFTEKPNSVLELTRSEVGDVIDPDDETQLLVFYNFNQA